MEDIVKLIYESESSEFALALLQNRYNELNNNSEELEISNQRNDVSVNKGFINRNTTLKYGICMEQKYKTDIYDDLVFFVSYIREKKIDSLSSFINRLPEVLISYFGVPSSEEDVRDNLVYEMLNKTTTDEEYFEIINNFKITNFKGLGIAQCSEFASLTSILTSIVGIESYLIMGESLIGAKGEAHAFNIIKALDNNYYLMDNAIPHLIFDEGDNLVGVRPNVFQLTDESFESFLHNEINLQVPLYNGRKLSDGSIKKIDSKICEYQSGTIKEKGVSR